MLEVEKKNAAIWGILTSPGQEGPVCRVYRSTEHKEEGNLCSWRKYLLQGIKIKAEVGEASCAGNSRRMAHVARAGESKGASGRRWLRQAGSQIAQGLADHG